MAGYKRTKTVYNLKFQDEEFEGLEVKIRAVPVGRLLDLGKSLDAASTDLSQIDPLFEMIADALVGWNLEDEDDAPVPATLEGIRSVDLELLFAIIIAWQEALVGVAAPLAVTSTSGNPSAVASIPMVALSESRAS